MDNKDKTTIGVHEKNLKYCINGYGLRFFCVFRQIWLNFGFQKIGIA